MAAMPPPGGRLGLTVSEQGEDDVVTEQGEIDIASSPELGAVLEGLEEEPRRVVIDISDVPFIDSSGLRVLIHFQQKRGENDRRVGLRGIQPNVRKLLDVVVLTDRFDEVE